MHGDATLRVHPIDKPVTLVFALFLGYGHHTLLTPGHISTTGELVLIPDHGSEGQFSDS